MSKPEVPTFDDEYDPHDIFGNPSNLISPESDEEEEDAYADETKAIVSEKDNNFVQLNKIVYNKTVAAEIVQRFALSRFNKAIYNKIFKFKSNKFYNFINIKRIEFIKKLQNIGGEFCQYEDEVCTIIKENHVYIIRIEARYDSIIAFVNIYGTNQEIVIEALNVFSSIFADNQGKNDLYCDLSWLIKTNGRTEEKSVREKLSDVFYKEAYPYVDVDNIIDAYLKGDEPILILTGSPGTGKTRFIRHILKRISMKKSGVDIIDIQGSVSDSPPTAIGYDDSSCKAMYTCSAEIIEEGGLFIDFLTENYDVLVLEDIDNHLRSRSDGNNSMYSLLSASNGLLVSTINSKKIILSTNLPGIEKIDPALIRPGRCFNIIQTRKLTWDESRKFLDVSDNGNKILPEDKEEFALSELYHLIKYNKVDTKYKKSKKLGFN